MLNTLQQKLLEPRDAASLAVFRFLFGAILSVSAVRFLWNGWVERFFVRPTFFFKYWGFEWVEVLPVGWFGLMVASFLAYIGSFCCFALGERFWQFAVAMVLIGASSTDAQRPSR